MKSEARFPLISARGDQGNNVQKAQVFLSIYSTDDLVSAIFQAWCSSEQCILSRD